MSYNPESFQRELATYKLPWYLTGLKLTLCSFGGLVEGQPESIVHDIENMVRAYIEKVIEANG